MREKMAAIVNYWIRCTRKYSVLVQSAGKIAVRIKTASQRKTVDRVSDVIGRIEGLEGIREWTATKSSRRKRIKWKYAKRDSEKRNGR